MRRIIVTRQIRHAPSAGSVKVYEPSPDVQQVPDRVAELAIANGWGRKPRGRPPKSKMLAGAPENK